MTDNWTIRSMLSWCEGYLSRHNDASARRSAETLVAHACGMERIGLYLDMDRPLAQRELDILREDVRRRGQGEPLQYITGTAPFRYLELKVAPGVLIPRPETEVLVSEALALIPPAPKPQDSYDNKLIAAMDIAAGEDARVDAPAQDDPVLMVADICTGTGCIACAIASEHGLTHVFATDISPKAVSLARENACDYGLADRVEVIECDLGSGLPSECAGKLDLVVSNPPYVPTAVMAQIPHEVSDYEPLLALDGGEDGLDVFRRLALWAYGNLKPNGGFVCELHETCLDAAAAFAEKAGYGSVRIVRDLAGRPRVLVALKAEVKHDGEGCDERA